MMLISCRQSGQDSNVLSKIMVFMDFPVMTFISMLTVPLETGRLIFITELRISQLLDVNNRVTYVPHSIYKVKNIYIYPDFVPKNALEGGEEYLKSLDTINYKGYYFITTKENPEIKYDLIIQALYLKPGSTFNVTNTEQSQSSPFDSESVQAC